MKKVRIVLSTYAADLFGVNSALYELGGLLVMHDASGCNSTYNTHDEPRWYTMDSMVYISGLIENDVILGNDEKLLSDLSGCVNEMPDELKPKFIVLTAALIPMFMSSDMKGLARVIEKRTGVRTFGFPTNAMDTYVKGEGMAFDMLAEEYCTKEAAAAWLAEHNSDNCESRPIRINLIGVTPLDFSVVGNVEAMRNAFESSGIEICTCMAMGDTLEQISAAGAADVNVIVSSGGVPAAMTLRNKFGTPYVLGMPIGKAGTEAMLGMIRPSAKDDKCRSIADDQPLDEDSFILTSEGKHGRPFFPAADHAAGGIWIVGESFFAASLRAMIESEHPDAQVHIACPTEYDCGMLRPGDVQTYEEEDFYNILNSADAVIADPIYRRVLSGDNRDKIRFVNFPHEAYSGRMYRSHLPVFIGPESGIEEWLRQRMSVQEEIGINDIMKNNVPYASHSRK